MIQTAIVHVFTFFKVKPTPNFDFERFKNRLTTVSDEFPERKAIAQQICVIVALFWGDRIIEDFHTLSSDFVKIARVMTGWIPPSTTSFEEGISPHRKFYLEHNLKRGMEAFMGRAEDFPAPPDRLMVDPYQKICLITNLDCGFARITGVERKFKLAKNVAAVQASGEAFTRIVELELRARPQASARCNNAANFPQSVLLHGNIDILKAQEAWACQGFKYSVEDLAMAPIKVIHWVLDRYPELKGELINPKQLTRVYAPLREILCPDAPIHEAADRTTTEYLKKCLDNEMAARVWLP